MLLWRWGRRSALTAVLAIVALSLGMLGPAQANTNGSLTVGITPGQPSAVQVRPGESTTMQWQVTCAGADCAQAEFSLSVPWPLQVVEPPIATAGRDESFDPTTGIYTVSFIEGLPSGTAGLPAGGTRQVPVEIALAGEGAADGQQWPVTAKARGAGSAEAFGYATVTAVVPPPPAPSDPPPSQAPAQAEQPTPDPQPSEPSPADSPAPAPTDEAEQGDGSAPVQALAASIGVNKTASESVVQPGQEFAYTLVNSCSSLTTPCLDFTVEDVLPAEFEVTSIPQSNSQRTVTYDSGTRLLTVQYIIPVTGGQGLPAGGSQSFQVGMRLPQQTAVTDGQVISNTAAVTAVDAQPQESTVEITASIPVRPEPVATKSWSQDTAVAQTGALSSLTLGVRNASSSSTPVTELVITDAAADTFNNFDVNFVGTAVVFPAGADQVVVEACTQPAGTCTDSDFAANASAPQTAAPLTATVPVNQITGLRYRFSNSGGGLLPFSVDPGSVTIEMQLRDTDRTSGDPIEPVSKQTVVNCATPALTAGEVTVGKDACQNFSILPNGLVATGTKTIFPDNSGSYSRNGFVVVGQDSGVTMKITAKNSSQVPAGAMTFIEPAPNSGAEFDKINVTKGRFTWPTGADEATLTVTCRSGSTPAPVTIFRTGNRQDLPDFGCDPGVFPASIELVLMSLGGGVPPTIPPNAEGSLELHGTASGVDATDVADGLRNCADVKIGIPGGASEGTAQPCGTTPVANPTPGIGNEVKTGYGVQTIVPGQPNPMRLAFRNTGNIPITNVIIEDPKQSQIAGADNPFQYMYLDSIVLPRNIPSTLQLWDPQRAGGAGYVDVVPGSPEFDVIKKRALGFRIVVTGTLQPGQTFGVNFEVLLRDDTTDPTGPAPDGTTFRNCAYFGIGAVPDNARARCADEVTVKRDGEYGFNMLKRIVSASIVRPGPGVPEQRVQVRHEVRNTGTFDLKELVVIDRDADFFDAMTFDGRSNDATRIDVNYPVGANRVQVDVCTSTADCANDVWVNGSTQNTKTPRIPAGVAPADVKGIRVTFSASGDGPLLPTTTQPSSSACPDANVCFGVVGQQYLDGTTTPIPDEVFDTSEAGAVKPDGEPLQPLSADASVSVVPGDPELRFAKGPSSRIGPGESAPFVLETTNSGTAGVNDVIVVDPLPDNLTFDPTIGGGTPTAPYVLEYTLPSGYPQPTTVDFREIKGGDPDAPPGCTDVNRVCKLEWSFPGYALPPGGIIKITFNVTLSPGTLAGQTIVNTAGTSGSEQGGTGNVPCDGASVDDDPAYGPGTFCTDPANITSVAGDNFLAQKWIKADPALGLLNAAGDVVAVGDPQCPIYANGADVYTRFPCVARVLPGGTIDYLIRGVNSGTNPAKEVVVLDGLPVQGDNGVLLTNESRGTEWSSRPTMLTPVTNVEGYAGVTTGYTDAAYMSPAFCRAGIQPPPNDTCPPGSFSAPFSDAATGFQTTFEFPDGSLLAPGQSFTLTWSMKAPDTLTNAAAEPTAWNSFALRPTFQQPGGGLSTLPATEPLKVGVAMPLATFTVDKSVIGLPQGVTLDAYEFAYRCTVGDTEVASGTFEITGNGSWVSPYVSAGAQCRVWETESQGGTSSAPDEAGAAVVDMADNNPQAAITNSYQSGALEIGKLVIWDDVPPIPVDPVTVSVSCSFPVSSNVLPGYPTTAVLADGDLVVYDNLPVGAECTIAETDTAGATQVVMVPSNASPTEGSTASVTLDSEETSLLINNLYETGGLRIEKTLTGPASQWAQGPFVFDVSCRLDGLPDLDYTVTLSPGTGLSTTISPIPANYVCTVAESDSGDASGFIVDPQVVTIPEYPIDEQPPGPAVVNATNLYPGGWIEVTKAVSGDAAGQMAGATFEVQVQCERDVVGGGTQVIIDETFPIIDGETVAIGRVDDPNANPPYAGQIPLQARCWATETNSVGATQVINPHPEGDKATISSPSANEWEIDNVFTNGGGQDGSIKVLKSVTGAAAQYAADFEFLAECTVGGFQIPDQRITIAAAGPLDGYFTGIPVGAVCDISETDNGGASGPVPVDLGQVTVPAEGQPAVEVEATNDFPAGYVSVAKDLTGGASAVMTGAEFTVQVQCERDLPAGGSEQILDRSVTLKGGEQVDIADPLPIGARCWITETDSVGATNVTLSNDVDNKAVVTSETPDLVLTATNEYVPGGVTPGGGVNVPAGIKVTKILTGSASQFAQGPFVFTAQCSLSGFALPTQSLTLTPAELVGYFPGLPIGASCAIAETENGSSPGPVPVDLGTVVVPANGAEPVAVTATNDFPGAVITVTKKVVGPGQGPFGFEVTCEGIDAPVGTFTLKATESRQVTVPVGAVCTVKETQNGGATSTTFAPGGRGDSTVVTATADSAVEVTNEFPAEKKSVVNGGGSGSLATTGGAGAPQLLLWALGLIAAGIAALIIARRGQSRR